MYNPTILTTRTYDPRWFIWTTVVLFVVAGSILTYITITSINVQADLYQDHTLVKTGKNRAPNQVD